MMRKLTLIILVLLMGKLPGSAALAICRSRIFAGFSLEGWAEFNGEPHSCGQTIECGYGRDGQSTLQT